MKQLDFEAFDQAMHIAIENAQVGFYFEEGGCWGFAHALIAKLKTLGYRPTIMFRPTGFVHAWANLEGRDLDYRGVFQAAPGAVPLRDLAELESVAAAYGGSSAEAHERDIASAHEILDNVFFQTDLALA